MAQLLKREKKSCAMWLLEGSMDTFTFLNRTSNRLILARIARDPQRTDLIYPTGLINP